MRTLEIIPVLILFCSANISVYGQDTTYIDNPSRYYSNKGDSERFDLSHRKGPRVKYARELIRYSKDRYKIENCYYYDNQRYTNSFSTDYTFINDSTITINKEKWHFQKIHDSLYHVSKFDVDYIEKGTVSSLIPFTKQGDFVYCNLKEKPLFIETFGTGEYKLECIKYDLIDSVYLSVDQIAKFPEQYGDLERYISERLQFPYMVRESAIQGTVYVKFVITSKGELVNLELLRSVDPLYDKEALRLITSLPNFEPGKVAGKTVNMYYFIPVKFKLN